MTVRFEGGAVAALTIGGIGTNAHRDFSRIDIINRVYYQGHSYLLTRGGTVMAQLSAVGTPLTGAEWRKRWKDRPRLDPHDAAE